MSDSERESIGSGCVLNSDDSSEHQQRFLSQAKETHRSSYLCTEPSSTPLGIIRPLNFKKKLYS